MDKLEFSSDNNNLLQLNCFPVLRLENPAKYSRHKKYQLWVSGKQQGEVECVSISVVPFPNLTESVALLLTGKGLTYLRGILRRMYPNVDWTATRLYFMMMRHLPQTVPVQEKTVTPIAYQASLPLAARVQKSS